MGSLVGSHILCELWYDYTRIAEIPCPALDPLKRDISVIVDSIKGFYHILDGDIAGTHDTVLHGTVLAHDAVLYLNVLYVFPEICNCSLGSFIVIAVGMVHIPQRCHLAALYAVKELCKTGCIRIYAVRLNEQSDIVLLCNGNELFQSLCNILVIDLVNRVGIEVCKYPYI